VKTLSALLRGYLYFKVQDKYFFRYNVAKCYKDSLSQEESVSFKGWHVWKGWTGFFYRIVSKDSVIINLPKIEQF
jgi:hypothetical protein